MISKVADFKRNDKEILFRELALFKILGSQKKMSKVKKICKNYNIDIGAAALQFSIKDKRITSTLCGVTSVQSIEKNLEWASIEIPQECWDEILKLPFSFCLNIF